MEQDWKPTGGGSEVVAPHRCSGSAGGTIGLIPALLSCSSSKAHSACPSLPALPPVVLKMLSFEFPNSFQRIVTLFCSEDLCIHCFS